MKNISIDGKKVIKVQNGHISIAFPTGIEKTGKAIRKMLKLLVQAEKEEERKPHNKDQIYKTLDGKFAIEFEKLFGKGACKKVFGVQKPSYTLPLSLPLLCFSLYSIPLSCTQQHSALSNSAILFVLLTAHCIRLSLPHLLCFQRSEIPMRISFASM